MDAKPVWRRLVTGAAKDRSRDLPDVSLFTGSYGGFTFVIICSQQNPCSKNDTTVGLSPSISLSSPMFAGIQAKVDQHLAAKGVPQKQGNAAPVLYALAGVEYGTGSGSPPTSLETCNSDNGPRGTGNCVFHNITRGSIATNCYQQLPTLVTPNCSFYGRGYPGISQVGLTSLNPHAPYDSKNEAYAAHPGWSFALGLSSVNASNFITQWSKFIGVE